MSLLEKKLNHKSCGILLVTECDQFPPWVLDNTAMGSLVYQIHKGNGDFTVIQTCVSYDKSKQYAKIVDCEMGFIPDKSLFLPLKILFCSQGAPHFQHCNRVLGRFSKIIKFFSFLFDFSHKMSLSLQVILFLAPSFLCDRTGEEASSFY